LHDVRQELAMTLYKYDAACRVIARLTKERDDARGALSDTKSNLSAAVRAAPRASMDVDNAPAPAAAASAASANGISDEIITNMQNVAKKLSKGRKNFVKEAAKKTIAREQLSKFSVKGSHPLHSASVPGIYALDLHPTQSGLGMTGGADGNAIVFNHESGKIVDTLKLHKKRVTDAKFHPTQDVLFTTSMDGMAAVWGKNDAGRYSLQTELKTHSDAVCGLSLHPSGDYFITASADKTWAFWDLASGMCREQVSDDKITAGYTAVSFHPDGLIFGAGTSDSLVRIFDVKQKKNVATFSGHQGHVTALAFSENGYYFATGDEQGTVKLWDLRSLANFHTISSSDVPTVQGLQFDQSGSYLAVAGEGVRVYASKSWELLTTLSDHTDVVTAVKFGSDASYLVSTSKDRTLKIYGN